MTTLLISGLPGKMAAEVVLAALEQKGMKVFPFALSSDSHDGETLSLGDNDFKLIGPDKWNDLDLPEDVVAIDYSTPDSALHNVEWFTKNNIPFVMGTTGFDSSAAEKHVSASGISAVIAPNMAVPILLVQAAMEWLGTEFPNALEGSNLAIRESHQSTKRDTSGTAKAMVQYFDQLGLNTSVDDIRKVRDTATQQSEIAVPEKHLKGHAFHRYTVANDSDQSELVLEHNICGRRVYASGTLMAVDFLMPQSAKGKVFSMIDVLKSSRA